VPSERVAIFIDGSNFYHCMKEEFGSARIDFYEFAKLLTGDRKLVRTYYYNAPVRREDGEERYQAQQRFFDALKLVPYFEVKLGRLEPRDGTVVEKGVDIALAVDMLHFAATDVYDTAILVTGDGDFASAVQAVKNLGKHVENAFFKAGHSKQLLDKADRFILLDRDLMGPCIR
jgi:uncharacterized LabA/DUF88 family protein